MDNTQRMIALLGRIRKQMNGAVTESMARDGQKYGLNYGVSIATIREIVAEEEPDYDFAKYLYKQQVRELKLCACHLADHCRQSAIGEAVNRPLNVGGCSSGSDVPEDGGGCRFNPPCRHRVPPMLFNRADDNPIKCGLHVFMVSDCIPCIPCIPCIAFCVSHDCSLPSLYMVHRFFGFPEMETRQVPSGFRLGFSHAL